MRRWRFGSYVPGNAVIVSPYFPPSTLAGVHRARHLAKHLSSVGWTPIVICVDEAFHEQRLDPGLAALVPRSVEIIKVRAIPLRVSRTFGIGDIGLRAWRPLQAAVLRTLASRKVDAILITGSPFYPMLAAPSIKRAFGVPVVLDFQDPWVSADGASQPWNSKAGLSHALAKALEPRALRSADFVTSVSDIQNAEMAARYPWLDSTRMAGIPIGGDPDDFIALRGSPSTNAYLEPGFIHLSYVGSYWPRVVASIRALFRAYVRLRSADPALAARIRLNFIGTNANPNDLTSHRVQRIAEAEDVADAVREMPARLSYVDALKVMVQSHGLLLLGSDEPHYTASKIYPALMSGRPFLSLFHRASSAHKILSTAGGGLALAFSDAEELAALDKPLGEALCTVATAPASLGAADPTAYAPFEARATAQRFGDIFDGLCVSCDRRKCR